MWNYCSKRKTWIEKTINSIPKKVNKIVIINDCSKDNTKMIVESLAKENNKIELINFETTSEWNLGSG